MNDTPVERLARTFHLTDFADYETAESSFEFLTRLIVWRIKHDERSDPANDKLLKRRGEEPFVRLSFFLYFATYDPVFFDLAKRMAGYTLERHYPPDRAHCLVAAQLLRMDAPKQKKAQKYARRRDSYRGGCGRDAGIKAQCQRGGMYSSEGRVGKPF